MTGKSGNTIYDSFGGSPLVTGLEHTETHDNVTTTFTAHPTMVDAFPEGMLQPADMNIVSGSLGLAVAGAEAALSLGADRQSIIVDVDFSSVFGGKSTSVAISLEGISTIEPWHSTPPTLAVGVGGGALGFGGGGTISLSGDSAGNVTISGDFSLGIVGLCCTNRVKSVLPLSPDGLILRAL